MENLPGTGKLDFPGTIPERNNILMEFIDDWVWLKSHRQKTVDCSARNTMNWKWQYLACIDGIRPTLISGLSLIFSKPFTAWHSRTDTFIDEVFETNVDMIFECIYNYMVITFSK